MKIVITALLMLCSFGAMADKYLRPGASGAANGSNWTDAYTTLSAAETGTSRGETIWVAAGAIGSATLNTAVSGSTIIIIKKATVAAHGTDTGWSDSYASGAATISGTVVISTHNWVIDGVSRSTQTTGYGFELTGPSPGGPGFDLDDGVTNITIKYVALTGHAATAPFDGGAGGDNAFWFGNNPRQLNISYNYAIGWGCCMVKLLGGSINDSLFEFNRFEYNRTRNTTPNEQHAEGVFAWAQNRNIWRHNVWVDIEGTGIIMLGDGGDNEIYGNLVYWTSAYPRAGQYDGFISNGSFSTWTAYTTDNNLFYNNTIIVPNSGGIEFGISYSGNTTGSGTARNNLYYCAGGGRNVYSTRVSADYDIFYGLTHEGGANGVNGTGNPFVDSANYDFRLVAGTVAGQSLSAPYNTDMLGATRGGDGTFDRGAFEFGTNSSPASGATRLYTGLRHSLGDKFQNR